MELDKTTLNDLSVFNYEEEFSIFHKLNFTLTSGGAEMLRVMFSRSLKTIEEINGVQQTLQQISIKKNDWPRMISNGTMMVIMKFYEATLDPIPTNPSMASAYTYKIFHGPDYSLIKYSAGHCFDFLKGMHILIDLFGEAHPPPMKKYLDRAKEILDKPQFSIIKKCEKNQDLSSAEMLHLAGFLRYHYKQNMLELGDIFYQFDAWHGMALAMDIYGLIFPTFVESNSPIVEASQLYHILLPDPVAYDVEMNKECNFLFLTGANMAGKSTFIKSVGAAVFLAHIGMGVPAKKMKLTLFDGMLSNINVMDNIAKGESYFFNEVQRVKNTILKINDGRKWLILIDELFKGTNVQDAMKCSTVVIEGLIKIKNSLFILSTHLYEIGEALQSHSNISFKYFETIVEDEQLKFSYQLKDGISNDRLGYLILKREKVIELLEGL